MDLCVLTTNNSIVVHGSVEFDFGTDYQNITEVHRLF